MTGRGSWLALSRRLRASQGSKAAAEGQPATNPADGRTARPAPTGPPTAAPSSPHSPRLTAPQGGRAPIPTPTALRAPHSRLRPHTPQENR
jgi:hypothetical protein